jgi:Helix-turn-helix domain
MSRTRRSIDVWCNLVRRSELSKATKVVAWALSSHMDNDTLAAWPSLDLLAEEANVARSTVQTAIKALKERGMLAITPGEKHREPNGKWRQDCNRYLGLIPPGAENRVPKTGYRDNRYVTTNRTLNRTPDDSVEANEGKRRLEGGENHSNPSQSNPLHVGSKLAVTTAELVQKYGAYWSTADQAYALPEGTLVRKVADYLTVIRLGA